MGTGVEAFEGDGAVERVRHRRRAHVDCDFVVVGVGVRRAPRSRRRRRPRVGNGVLVDQRLPTSAPGVFAAGDVANACIRSTAADPRRALGQRAQPGPGRGPQDARRAGAYDRLPYFFSDQYDVGMEYSGLAAAATASSSGATRPSASSSPSGCSRTA